jgi:hypothetical protein
MTHPHERWTIVAAVAKAISHGGGFLDQIPALLKRIIREEMWREYLLPNGDIAQFSTFLEFIVSPWGLDTSLSLLQRICGENLEVLDVLDKATIEKPGGNNNPYGCKGKESRELLPITSEELFHNEQLINSDNITIDSKERPERGTSRQYALRRLRNNRPDIHARVLAGELSPHAAMIEAGFRHEMTPLDYLHRYWRQVSPEDRLRFLAEMLTPSERRALALGVTEEDL